MGRAFVKALLVALVGAVWSGGAAGQLNLLDTAKEALGGVTGGSESGSSLTSDEIALGLRDALRVGTERVVGQVGVLDGFNADPAIRIPLPGPLQTVQSALQKVGMSGMADDLELKLNRAAEAAAPEAKELFFQAISEMSMDDVQSIFSGPDDAATRYFQEKMSPPLAERMAPIVDASLQDVGAVASLDAMMTQYDQIPFVPDVQSDLTDYVVDKGMDGLFHYVAKEEAAIRNNPAERTTDILKRVFGS
ncbi:MAG: DUF4197 domain-containing protein [Pseudomonadota bacterium]